MSAFWRVLAAKERVGRLELEAQMAQGRLAEAQALLRKELESAGLDLAKPIHFDFDAEAISNREDHGRPA